MSDAGFVLDPRLAADTLPVADFTLCALRLMDDARFPWVVLVPRRTHLVEVDDLDPSAQSVLWSEIAQAGRALRQIAPGMKLNLGQLGNVVRQLHVHVVARREGDAAWPGPVWGAGSGVPYDDASRDARVAALRQALDATG